MVIEGKREIRFSGESGSLSCSRDKARRTSRWNEGWRGWAGREEGKGRLKNEPSALGLSNWPHGPAGSWKREGSARSILRDKRAKISGFLRT